MKYTIYRRSLRHALSVVPLCLGLVLAGGCGTSPGFVSPFGTIQGQNSGSFTITALPTTLSVRQGTTGHYTVTLTPSGGWAGSVTATATGQPSNVSYTPTSGTNNTVDIAVSPGYSSPTGSYTITLTVTDGTTTRTVNVTLTILSSQT